MLRLALQRALLAQLSSLLTTSPSDMDIPNSPLQMQRQWIYQKLDELPEGSSVTIPVQQYRDMITRQLQLSDLVARQQKLLEEHVPDY